MRAAFDPRCAVMVRALCAAVACAATGCGPQVDIVLVRGDSLEGKPAFVRFEFGDLTNGELERLGPYSTTGLPSDELARVPPEHDFVINVIGCKTAKEDECLEPPTFIAHGCSGTERLARGEEKTIEITLHSAEVGADECGLTEVTE